ncbi:YihY/virulence factor BrkB family protein [Anaerosporobacter sp.]|uniref:YihY/virulence factor BrkB family protein n=1 Tax=Anaerosporobacter sp. TaxID=1872529 RepID=UPI00286EFCCE|nr:YihY/virulence factor BrkB family protein [Anaerosporobacter sp.]
MKLVSIIQAIRTASRKISNDFVPTFSAQAAFFIIISFFPFVMFLLTLIQFLPLKESELYILIRNLLPSGINTYIVSLVSDIYVQPATTIISITAITTLWSASRGFLAIVKGLNNVYEIKETRNYIRLRITSAIYTLAFAIIIVVSLALLVFGNRLYLLIQREFPLINDLALAIIGLRTIISLALYTFFFLLLYVVIPNRKTKLLNELPGAVIAAAGWMLFSFLYSIYIDNFAKFSTMYGSLTAIVLMMLWLYFCMYILFLGAEINVLLPKLWPFNKIFKHKAVE